MKIVWYTNNVRQWYGEEIIERLFIGMTSLHSIQSLELRGSTMISVSFVENVHVK
jgi:hypothetical protein